MTIGYNAGEEECRNTLIRRLVENGYDLSAEITASLESFSKVFHKFLKTKLFDLLYIKSPLVVKNLDFLELDDARINLIYFKEDSYNKKHDLKFGKERWVFARTKLTISTDRRSSDTARNANLIQARDAHLARYLVREISDIYCIHDCFGVSIYRLHNLMDKSNDYFSKHLGYEVYSLFILI